MLLLNVFITFFHPGDQPADCKSVQRVSQCNTVLLCSVWPLVQSPGVQTSSPPLDIDPLTWPHWPLHDSNLTAVSLTQATLSTVRRDQLCNLMSVWRDWTGLETRIWQYYNNLSECLTLSNVEDCWKFKIFLKFHWSPTWSFPTWKQLWTRKLWPVTTCRRTGKE